MLNNIEAIFTIIQHSYMTKGLQGRVIFHQCFFFLLPLNSLFSRAGGRPVVFCTTTTSLAERSRAIQQLHCLVAKQTTNTPRTGQQTLWGFRSFLHSGPSGNPVVGVQQQLTTVILQRRPAHVFLEKLSVFRWKEEEEKAASRSCTEILKRTLAVKLKLITLHEIRY